MPNKIKMDYEQSFNKRAVQSDILPLIQGRYKHVVGLAGPNIDSYLRMVKKAGIIDASIYENNALQLLVQVQRFKSVIPTTVRYADILDAPAGMEDTLYDLDFCCSVSTAREHIKKFSKDPTITTLAMRPYDAVHNMKEYMKYLTGSQQFMVETDRVTKHFIKYNLKSKTNKKVACYTYHDTTPMLVFTNI